MKHTIVSLSVSRAFAEEMERLQQEMGFSGRSEMLRAGLRKLIVEQKEQEKLSGQAQCVLIVVHNTQTEADVTRAKHDFADIISTQIHNNLKGGKCLEVFFLSGKAAAIREMHNTLETNKSVDYVKLIVT